MCRVAKEKRRKSQFVSYFFNYGAEARAFSFVVNHSSVILAYTFYFKFSANSAFFAIPTLELPFVPRSVLHNIPF